ncbi:MAG: hypothetical protein BIFFINMI_02093 [Phycisphaerae bacterium]|nr:hypothetical protein [Phycisphaerae bacterium]
MADLAQTAERPTQRPAGTGALGHARVAARSFAAAAWPFAVLAGLTAVFFAQLLFSSPRLMIHTGDVTNYLQWSHEYLRQELSAWRLPLWSPYIYGGVAFAANPQTTTFYPPTWAALLLLGADEGLKLIIVAHVYFTGAFMYLFLRRLQLGKLACTLAAAGWMFGSYFAARGTIGHPTLLITGSWIPAVLYCFERCLQSRGAGRAARWAFWTGLALGVQLTGGGDQICYYTVLLVGFYGLIRVLLDRPAGVRWYAPRGWLPWVGRMSVIATVSALAGGVQLLPTAQFAMLSDRSANGYGFAAYGSMPFQSLAGYLLHWRSDLWAVWVNGVPGTVDLDWEYAGYVGIFTLVAAGLSFHVRRRAPLLAMRILLPLFVLVMLGSSTPAFRLLYHLPGMKTFRIPGRAVIVVSWCLCVMAAFGLHWLATADWARVARGRWRIVVTAVGLSIVTAAVVWTSAGWLIRLPMPRSMPNTRVTLATPLLGEPVLLILAAVALAAVAGWTSRRTFLALAAGLIVADMMLSAPVYPLDGYDRDGCPGVVQLRAINAHIRAADGLTAPGDPDPLYRVNFCTRQFPPDASLYARVENVNAYWPISFGRYYRFGHAMQDTWLDPRRRHEFQDRLYDSDPFWMRVMNVRAASHFTREGGWQIVYAAPGQYVPRAWLVDSAEVLPCDAATIARMRRLAWDPLRSVLLTAEPSIKLDGTGQPPGRVTKIRRLPGAGLEIQTDSSRAGYLVLSEQFYPGWSATVDGKPVKLEQADYIISAIPLPAGEHRIEYRYRPPAVYAGAAMTGTAWLAALVLLALAAVARLRGTTVKPNSSADYADSAD